MVRSVFINGRYRSAVTLPGYRLGMKPGNAGRKFPAEVLTREEIERLLAALGRGYAGARNRAIVVVLWRCGLRVAEALALHPKDVDLAAGTVTVLHGKGDRRRLVGIDTGASAVVEKWMLKRAELGLGRGAPLFCVISQPTLGKPLYSAYVREALKDAALRAGIDKRVHPHGFRHTFACELAREGAPMTTVQRLLGHGDLATTARYLAGLSPWEAIDFARLRQWGEPVSHPGAPLELAA